MFFDILVDKMKELIKRIYLHFSFLIAKIYVKCAPMYKHVILFSNVNGKGFGCNPKYIAMYIHEHHLTYSLYWRVSNADIAKTLPYYIKPIYDGTVKDYIFTRLAHFYIHNSRVVIAEDRKDGQYNIQTWHAIFGFKHAERAAENELPAFYVENAKLHSERTDLFIAASNWHEYDYKKNFWYDGEIMKSGYPRDDIYFSENKTLKSIIKKHLCISNDTKIVIYAPTFRDSGDVSIYHIPTEQIVCSLQHRTNEKWVMIVRLHPNVPGEVKNMFSYNEHVIEATTYPDPQELFFVSDLMITDYSSSSFDFLVQHKPVILYAPDYGKDSIRSVTALFNDIPFPHCYDVNSLLNVVKNLDENELSIKMAAFLKDYKGENGEAFISYDDGHASERVVERIQQVMEGKIKTKKQLIKMINK